MKYLRVAAVAFSAVLLVIVLCMNQRTAVSDGLSIGRTAAYLPASIWNPLIVSYTNDTGVRITTDGIDASGSPYPVYMADDRTIMAPLHTVESAFDCAAFLISSSELTIEKNDTRLVYPLGADSEVRNESVNGRVYVSPAEIAEDLGYDCQWEAENSTLSFTAAAQGGSSLPARYDYRNEGRQSVIKDQGDQGTCWATAATTALETSLLPAESIELAPDHVSLHNSFNISQDEGGNYTMSVAYMTAWEGPVREAEDPYGDGFSPDGLAAQKHVQEIRMPKSGDTEEIKRAVYRYGGVESAIYFDLDSNESISQYYSRRNSAYCYTGDNTANLDIVIIGWDDAFSGAAFTKKVPGDGAFICQNSWGSSFGENGVFYISYYDTVIGTNNIVYSIAENNTNYTSIYQTDMCGWIGSIGYNSSQAMFANAYTAYGDEDIEAAGFYATTAGTQYEVYFVTDFTGAESLTYRTMVASGALEDAGYYTVPFRKAQEADAGEKFAVVVKITSPDTQQPVAIEYKAEDIADVVELGDGEGYLSCNGGSWSSAEKDHGCNVCLKVYANPREQ